MKLNLPTYQISREALEVLGNIFVGDEYEESLGIPFWDSWYVMKLEKEIEAQEAASA